MDEKITVIGAGLAGSEAALALSSLGASVTLVEQRPVVQTAVHKTADFAELVCSNSLKSTKPSSAAGMLKQELEALGSQVYFHALKTSVDAGGALAVDRIAFSKSVTRECLSRENIEIIRGEARSVGQDGSVMIATPEGETRLPAADAAIVASGPLTQGPLAAFVMEATNSQDLAFYDAAAPIVLADSLDHDVVFRQNRYEDGEGDYLNAPFTRDEYEAFFDELVSAERVIKRDFESKDLFQACQPIEEIARKGKDAPRFGALKPVGLTDPRSGKRPWAAVQLRAEDRYRQSYNLVGFQTNLKFSEQQRVFRMIPGLTHAEFARYGVMHRNTFIDAPRCLSSALRAREGWTGTPLFFAGQLSGTEGYCEAIRSGLHAAISSLAYLRSIEVLTPPVETAFGALLAYATDPLTTPYQPMHVNFGIMKPLDVAIRNKGQRYEAYAKRGSEVLHRYCEALNEVGLLPRPQR